ncbi:uncharacterized protein PRCAT00004525001 [Priceomyces carsonii]|uniref:uncharacterized protein n=1 Tax=Priceomyces carsonii TaxID=28549 RepID=UPI002ED841A0|nr:unnamed protein product [Priceomyces carsonii]
MSFVGGGADCSANGNVISQFNKHTQQDRSLQRQSAAQPGFSQVNRFKNDATMSSNERKQMEQFMGANHDQSFQFQPMRHELNMINQNHLPSGSMQYSWSNEFQTQSPSPVLKQKTPGMSQIPTGNIAGNSQWANEFRQSPVEQQNLQQPQFHSITGGMRYGGSYRPMMGMSTMAGSSQNHTTREPLNQEQQVDWDNQFRQIEELTNETKEAEEDIQKADSSPDFVVDDKYQATFQEVWDSLNSEAIENDFISQQYEDFKNTKVDPLPADLSQWERDFAKYALTRAHFGDYRFEEKESNQFLDLPQDQDPYEIGLQLMENGAKLSEAALAFEAAIQKNQNHIDAWLKLGEVQTQNEKEIAGISALEKCLELHPENSEALMTLAISYINEGYDNAAFATLERWISTKYPQVADRAREQNPAIADEDRLSLNKRVTELFIRAAQLSPNQANMDPDVQMGLGVLFYANEDFDKTIDCFKAALSIKPDDAVLWNRLGASLANSNRSEEAVNAYFKALELKPTFVRARYNLGVSCINIGCYKEAAEHLLSGLSMHQVENVDTSASSTLNQNQSSSLLETLKRAFIAMDRRDLLELVKPGMSLNQFRDEFTF